MKLSAFRCCNEILEKINLKSRKVYLGSRLWRIQPVVGCSFVHGFAACGEVACHHMRMTGCSPHGQEWKGEAEGASGCWPSTQEEVPPANSSSDSTGWGPELSALHPRPLSDACASPRRSQGVMIRQRKVMHIELPLTLTKLKKKSNVEKLVNYINKQSIYSQKSPKNLQSYGQL